MKTRNMIILCVLIFIVIATVITFLPNEESTNAGEYMKKAEEYDKSGDSLQKATDKIEIQVNNKQIHLNSQLQKLNESIQVLNKNKSQNKELIDAAKKIQEQLLDDYCRDMTALGQTNMERCNGRKQ